MQQQVKIMRGLWTNESVLSLVKSQKQGWKKELILLSPELLHFDSLTVRLTCDLQRQKKEGNLNTTSYYQLLILMTFCLGRTFKFFVDYIAARNDQILFQIKYRSQSKRTSMKLLFLYQRPRMANIINKNLYPSIQTSFPKKIMHGLFVKLKPDGVKGLRVILQHVLRPVSKFQLICEELLSSYNIIPNSHMSIAQYKENLAAEASFFNSQVFPIPNPRTARIGDGCGTAWSPLHARKILVRSSEKAEKAKMHKSQGKLTKGTFLKLKDQAEVIRKKITCKSSEIFCRLPLAGLGEKNETNFSSVTQRQDLSDRIALKQASKHLEVQLPSGGEDCCSLSTLGSSKQGSDGGRSDHSTPRHRDFKILQLGNRREVFEVVRFLDSGAFGEVFLVRHLATGMLLCLKSMRKDQFSEESMHQLAREIRIQSSLNHPNIIKIYGCTADERNIYLLLEPCLGKNLYKMMAGGAIEQGEARGYLQQVCHAVAYMHDNNILHRDIKPQNVLVDCGTAKLCDFGWAVQSPLLRDTRCGTPIYSPPEIIRGESYDSSIDVWCIGQMAYQMLYGALPFGITHADDLQRIATEPVPFPPSSNVSEEAEDFLRGCLAKYSYQRISIRRALEHEFLQKKKQHFRQTFP